MISVARYGMVPCMWSIDVAFVVAVSRFMMISIGGLKQIISRLPGLISRCMICFSSRR